MRFVTRAASILLPVISISLLSIGCDEKSTNAAKDAAGSAKDAAVAVSEQASEAFAAARDKAVHSFGPQIEKAKSMMESFRGKLSSVSADQKPALESLLADLDIQFKSVNDMLARLKTEGADKWQGLSVKLGDALQKLMAGLTEAKGKFGM